MKLFSKQADNPQAIALWEPLDLGIPVVRPEVSPEEVMALFMGELPPRPPAGLRGSSDLKPRNSGIAYQAWALRDLTELHAEDEQPAVSLIKARVPEPVAPKVAPRPAEAPVPQAVQENLRQMIEETQRMRAEAQLQLDEAQRHAQEILEKARKEAEVRLQQAYQAGKAQAEAQFASSIQAAQSIVNEMGLWQNELFAQSEPVVIGMIKEIAQTLFSNGMQVDPIVLQDTFTKALVRARTMGNLKIFVHPSDASRIDPAWRDFQTVVSGQRIQIIPTESVKPGGCYIEGDQGAVDARIENRLDAAMKIFDQTTGGEGA